MKSIADRHAEVVLGAMVIAIVLLITALCLWA
jgi:hypothetical protein